MVTSAPPARQPTRQRLLEQGMRLFADRGFRETTVGEIEAAAGLEPRRGALYRHYPTKEALLEAALEQHLQVLAAANAELSQPEGTSVRDQAIAIGRWLLAELDRETTIMRILEQDGDRLPALRDRVRESLVDSGYEMIAEHLRGWLAARLKRRGGRQWVRDVDALSAVLLGGLVNYRRSTWTFRVPPAGLDEERYLAGWADLCVAATQPPQTER